MKKLTEMTLEDLNVLIQDIEETLSLFNDLEKELQGIKTVEYQGIPINGFTILPPDSQISYFQRSSDAIADMWFDGDGIMWFDGDGITMKKSYDGINNFLHSLKRTRISMEKKYPCAVLKNSRYDNEIWEKSIDTLSRFKHITWTASAIYAQMQSDTDYVITRR